MITFNFGGQLDIYISLILRSQILSACHTVFFCHSWSWAMKVFYWPKGLFVSLKGKLLIFFVWLTPPLLFAKQPTLPPL